MNLFESQDFKPMFLEQIKNPFNDSNYLFEIKFDGIRALIFAEPSKIVIKSRSKEDITHRYPELLSIKENVKKKVIFDGEIVLMDNNIPSFEKLKERILINNKNKIDYYAENFPVVFVVYDILYEDKSLVNLPLLERKKILNKYKDTSKFIKSEYVLKNGKDLFKFVLKNNLEGIIAKKIDSIYQIDKRSNDWLKIKNIKDDDFTIFGYKEENKNAVASLLVGKIIKNKNHYIASVTIGKRNPEYSIIKKIPKINNTEIEKEGYIPINPSLICTVEYLEKTKNGKLRQPHFKNLKY